MDFLAGFLIGVGTLGCAWHPEQAWGLALTFGVIFVVAPRAFKFIAEHRSA